MKTIAMRRQLLVLPLVACLTNVVVVGSSSSSSTTITTTPSTNHHQIILPGATGSGVYELAVAWARAFESLHSSSSDNNNMNVHITLNNVGSGEAQRALVQGGDENNNNNNRDATVWGLGEASLLAEDYHSTLLQQLPSMVGAVAIVYSNHVILHHKNNNTSSSSSSSSSPLLLKLDLETLAGIFNKTIVYWDDVRIQQQNPDLQLAHEYISVVVRADESGQTSIVSNALHRHVPSWSRTVGSMDPNIWKQQSRERTTEFLHPGYQVERSLLCADDNVFNNSATRTVITTPTYSISRQSNVVLGLLKVPYSIGYVNVHAYQEYNDYLSEAKIATTSKTTSTKSAVYTAPSSWTATDYSLNPQTLQVELFNANYPLTGLAYWYLPSTPYDNCDQAWYLLQFIYWTMTDAHAQDIGRTYHWKVPPSFIVYATLERLKQLQCINEQNVVISAWNHVPKTKIQSNKGNDEDEDDDDQEKMSNTKRIVVIGVPIAAFILVQLILQFKKKREELWKLNRDDLIFTTPPVIVGRGSFGVVLLAEYRGTQVAVKRALPPRPKRKAQSARKQQRQHHRRERRRGSMGNGSVDTVDDLNFSESQHPDIEKAISTTTTDATTIGETTTTCADSGHDASFTSGATSVRSSGVSVASGYSNNDNASTMTNRTSNSTNTNTNRPKTTSSGRRRALLKEDFVREMKVLSKLRHPCITTVMGAVMTHNHGRNNSDPLLVMEYMEHGSLYDILHNETMFVEHEMILRIIKDIASGLRFLHTANPQVIHCDLKSKNVLIDRHFGAKLCDFGLYSNRNHKGPAGTPYWMAPELLSGQVKKNTSESDIYSFGIVLYEAFSRKEPYEECEQEQQQHQEHQEVEEVIDEADHSKAVIQSIIDSEIQRRPPIPDGMPPIIATIYQECLNADPTCRPTVQEIDTRLKDVCMKELVTPMDKKQKELADNVQANGNNTSLDDIFPPHIVKALQEGRKIEPEQKDCVTVFFSDIVGYADIVKKLSPSKVSDMLHRLYTVLDELSQQHDLYKVETIGDSYMAVTNLVKDQSNDHVKRIAQFAIDAITIANETLIDLDNPSFGCINIRVGFHSGPVVANIVGNRNPRYCLFGDTVNTASRMESNSEMNRINCSKSSYLLLQEQMPELPMNPRGLIQVKGKGEMAVYWVNETPQFFANTYTTAVTPEGVPEEERNDNYMAYVKNEMMKMNDMRLNKKFEMEPLRPSPVLQRLSSSRNMLMTSTSPDELSSPEKRANKMTDQFFSNLRSDMLRSTPEHMKGIDLDDFDNSSEELSSPEKRANKMTDQFFNNLRSEMLRSTPEHMQGIDLDDFDSSSEMFSSGSEEEIVFGVDDTTSGYEDTTTNYDEEEANQNYTTTITTTTTTTSEALDGDEENNLKEIIEP